MPGAKIESLQSSRGAAYRVVRGGAVEMIIIVVECSFLSRKNESRGGSSDLR